VMEECLSRPVLETGLLDNGTIVFLDNRFGTQPLLILRLKGGKFQVVRDPSKGAFYAGSLGLLGKVREIPVDHC
jgi:hypothetical protein